MAFAQGWGFHYSSTAVDPNGKAIPFASIDVCALGTLGLPCFPQAPIYSDFLLRGRHLNPFAANAAGQFDFWVPAGQYQLCITNPAGGQTACSIITSPCVPNAACGGAASIPASTCRAPAPYGEFCATPQAPTGSAIGLANWTVNPFLTCVNCSVSFNFTVQVAGDTILVAGPAAGDSIGVVPPSPCTDGATTLTVVSGQPVNYEFQYEKNVSQGNHTIVCGVNGSFTHTTNVAFLYELSNFGSIDLAVNANSSAGGVSAQTVSVTTTSTNEGIIVVGSCSGAAGECISTLSFTPDLTDLVSDSNIYKVIGGNFATASSGMFGAATAGTYTETVNANPPTAASPNQPGLGISMIAIIPATTVLTGPLGTRPISLSDLPGGAGHLVGTIASGSAVMTTAAIAAISGSTVSCGATVTVSASGVATTDTITIAPNAAEATPNTGLRLSYWPTANNVNFAWCNPTASSQTPVAETLNWRVLR